MIGDTTLDRQMSHNGGVRFIGALWDSQEVDELSKGETIKSPLEILKYI